jgi:hypothetical protein
MGMSVRQMLAQIDSAELAEWAAYYQIEPFGDAAADQRHGIATSVLANVNRDAKRKPDPYRWTDFVPHHPANQVADEGELLSDPEAQSRLIKQKLFNAK